MKENNFHSKNKFFSIKLQLMTKVKKKLILRYVVYFDYFLYLLLKWILGNYICYNISLVVFSFNQLKREKKEK